MPELTINPDAAFAIMLKTREFDAKVEQTDPDSGSNPSDDRGVDALETGPSDDTQREIVSAISDLNDDEQLDLIALILVGREDYTLEEWRSARLEASTVGRAHVGKFVTDIPLVSDFLEEGLSQFNLTVQDYLDRQ
jgi:hypothetical protein